jgi:hypothetical protein
MSNFVKGIYFVEVKTANSFSTEKIIKEWLSKELINFIE